MADGQLPGEGPVRLGPVALPAGKLVTGFWGEPVAWVTVDPVPESGRVWAALSEMHPRTGLVPIQWDDEGFTEPEDPREADELDAEAVLRARWHRWLGPPRDDTPDWRQIRAPFDREFPGLAAPGRTPLAPAERRHALEVALPRIRRTRRVTPAARIGLVAAGRPADALAVIGWGGLVNAEQPLLELTAVLRSWEDRFGAWLIDVADAELRLFVDRPPRSLEAAQRVAAEQVGLADECIESMKDIPNIAVRLVNAPIWTFWWD
jgi:Domain of unknown function (DUF4253)